MASLPFEGKRESYTMHLVTIPWGIGLGRIQSKEVAPTPGTVTAVRRYRNDVIALDLQGGGLAGAVVLCLIERTHLMTIV